MELLNIIRHAGLVGWVTLGILGTMSIFSWAIIGQKFRLLSHSKTTTREFIDQFWNSRNLENFYTEAKRKFVKSPISKVFQSGYVELVKLSKSLEMGPSFSEHGEPSLTGKGEAAHAPTSFGAKSLALDSIDNVERSLHRSANAEINKLEKHLSFLATTGATAPFIGLFGTVMGIMRSFRQIGLSGSANIADVAPGISEALLATAAGLLAAIPAVIAYNQFHSQIKTLALDMQNFSSDFLNIVKRHFFK